MAAPGSRVWVRVRTWVRRYLPAEISGSLSAVGIGALGLVTVPEQPLLIAYACSLAETVGFYAAFLIDRMRNGTGEGEPIEGGPLRRLWVLLVASVVEFGPAEIVDSLLLRPLAVFGGLLLASHPLLGILLGKIAADVVFYALAVTSYESLVRRLLGRLRRPAGVVEPRPDEDEPAEI